MVVTQLFKADFFGVPLRVGLSAASPRSCLAAVFPLLSLTRFLASGELQVASNEMVGIGDKMRGRIGDEVRGRWGETSDER